MGTILFSFDVESNGLHGTPFAVGVVVYDTAEHKELQRFGGFVDLRGIEDTDPWVSQNGPTVSTRSRVSQVR